MKRFFVFLSVLFLAVNVHVHARGIGKIQWIFPQSYSTNWAKTSATLNSCLTAVGSEERMIAINGGAWEITNNVTFPTNTTVYIEHGSTLNVYTNVVLTINGSFLAGPYEVFTGNGTATGSASFIYRWPVWGDTVDFDIGNGVLGTNLANLLFSDQSFIMAGSTTGSFDYAVITNLNILNNLDVGNDFSVSGDSVLSNLTVTGSADFSDEAVSNLVTSITNNSVLVNSFVPAGTMISSISSNTPSGYLYCDGTSYQTNTYPGLFAAIGYSCGTTNAAWFNVPDMRGQFIRGQDDGAGVDPDAGSRTAQTTGGNTGDNVGSQQSDQYESHTHDVRHSIGGGLTYIESVGNSDWNAPDQFTGITQSSGGNETRPDNIAVRYYIKY